ncbi:MAG: response regulator [Proteobacteria bacterium]|nr:response regulator [Pseudomonadota bacterium]
MDSDTIYILIVDDVPQNLLVLEKYLHSPDITIIKAASGNQALGHVLEYDFALILMDVQMPEMDGLEATRQIRKKKSGIRNGKIPVIAMTAHALAGDREKCLRAGMNDYLSKPISPATLAETLKKWLPGKTGESREKQAESAPQEGILPTIFNRNDMLERLLFDHDLAQTVMGGFLDDIPKQVDIMVACLVKGDLAAVQRQAHSIKGASANVGGEALRDIAFKAEKAAGTGDLQTVWEYMPDLKNNFSLLKEAMEKMN